MTLHFLYPYVNLSGMPQGMNYNEVQEVFLSVDGIVAVHNLRIWGLTTEKTALSAHLAISKLLQTCEK